MLILAASSITAVVGLSAQAADKTEKFIPNGQCIQISQGIYTCQTNVEPFDCTTTGDDQRFSDPFCQNPI